MDLEVADALVIQAVRAKEVAFVVLVVCVVIVVIIFEHVLIFIQPVHDCFLLGFLLPLPLHLFPVEKEQRLAGVLLAETVLKFGLAVLAILHALAAVLGLVAERAVTDLLAGVELALKPSPAIVLLDASHEGAFAALLLFEGLSRVNQLLLFESCGCVRVCLAKRQTLTARRLLAVELVELVAMKALGLGFLPLEVEVVDGREVVELHHELSVIVIFEVEEIAVATEGVAAEPIAAMAEVGGVGGVVNAVIEVIVELANHLERELLPVVAVVTLPVVDLAAVVEEAIGIVGYFDVSTSPICPVAIVLPIFHVKAQAGAAVLIAEGSVAARDHLGLMVIGHLVMDILPAVRT